MKPNSTIATLKKPQNWWKGNIIYQIYPRSYQDSDGDGIGDIKGITSRLGYVAELGVDTIWLSPIFTSPMKDMGYDVSDYTDIDPSFGTLADFDEMIARAHELGLAVMIDQVLSHCSNQHKYFQESRQDRTNPKADWYIWADPNPDGTPPNNWPAVFGGPAWEWEPKRQQFFMHNFLIEQPDFNFHNKEVQAWHLDNMRFWLERGVDGFRLDTVNFYFHDKLLRDNPADPRALKSYTNTYDMQYHIHSKNQPENIPFLEKMRALCNEYNAAMVGEMGEAHHPIEMMGEYTLGEKRLHMCYSFEFLGGDYTPEHFREKIEQFVEGAPNGWPAWAFSNHDVKRHASRWAVAGEEDLIAKQCAALLMSLYGSICIYQGEELGQLETVMEFHELTDPPGIRFWPENPGRDGCRTPMVWNANANDHAGFSQSKPWLPIKAPQLARAVSAQVGDDASVLAYYKTMISFRQNSDALKLGAIEFIDLGKDILVFKRGDLTCVFNFAKTAVNLKIKNPTLANAPHIDTAIIGGVVKIGPNGAAFLEG